ncbi:MAG: 3-phosphoglycerate dehydrogenase [Ruminococcaceae bacterium]|nr:3-phosphoglycerate dehydrogenase [Oscillospiraceae bacterium]
MAQKKILTMNKIAKIGLDRFNDEYVVSDSMEQPDAIMVRSASLHEMEMPESLLAIARAGAGTNNIPIDRCSEQGIVVFNTPGANANAVKELVIAALLMSSRRVIPAVDWAKGLKGNGAEVPKMVEKGKSQFAGPEIKGKKLGVIGLGAIGVLVANTAYNLGMDVLGYDPYLSIDAAWSLSRGTHHAATLDEIYTQCDYITLHVPLNDETRGMIDSAAIAKMKDGVRLLNFSRAELVNGPAVVDAVKSGKVGCYVVDFPTDEVIGVDGIVAIPHLGASTPESEDNCAIMAADELRWYLRDGTVRNSVNLPNLDGGRAEKNRICIIHKNIPNMLAQFSTVLSGEGVNIENLLSKSKKDIAYTQIDFDSDVPAGIIEHLSAIEGVIRVRIITPEK